jgi:Zn-dependent metalloprotease
MLHPQDCGEVRPRTACHCFIAPPDLLARVIEEGTAEQRSAAVQTIAASASMRSRRALIGRAAREIGPQARALASAVSPAAAGGTQTVYDAEHGGQSSLPGKRVRGSGDPPVADDAVNEAYDATAATYDFYKSCYGRDSIDGEGMELVSSVHFSSNFDNAFWNGLQMVYGDGSGHIFQKGGLTKSIDVPGHEMTHGVTERTAGLEYSKQPGALNESFSDVFGSLIKQHKLGQTADQADWLIGEGTLVPSLGAALRSMKAPGTAYSGDRQPATMADYVDLPDDGNPENDNGGVHINSGIPNHAFYLAATAIGGNAWEKAGRVWYQALTGGQLTPSASFEDAARASLAAASELFGEGAEHAAVADAWQQVGVLP